MARKKSELLLWTEAAIVRLVFFAFSRFPHKTAMRFGAGFGRLLTRVFPRFLHTALRNLEIAYPEMPAEERRRVAAGTFESLGRHLGFISHFRFFEREDIRSLVDVHGIGNYRKARETGRGIIFFTGHFGSWEVFNLLPPAFDEKINILVRRIDNPKVEEYVDRLRTKFGSVTLGKRQAPRKMYRLLEAGEVVGILADLNAQLHDGVFVDFFGVKASTTTSIAKLALKTNAVILPAFAVWNRELEKYEVFLEPELEYEKSDSDEEAILSITKAFTAVIERYVRKYPEQWLWIHKRWNTRPKGEKGLY
ncbi:MAG: lysophospholipid acyltransferase family protein [Pyrinomonadaceae bacterium]